MVEPRYGKNQDKLTNTDSIIAHLASWTTGYSHTRSCPTKSVIVRGG
jgi:hypothetical protein